MTTTLSVGRFRNARLTTSVKLTFDDPESGERTTQDFKMTYKALSPSEQLLMSEWSRKYDRELERRRLAVISERESYEERRDKAELTGEPFTEVAPESSFDESDEQMKVMCSSLARFDIKIQGIIGDDGEAARLTEEILLDFARPNLLAIQSAISKDTNENPMKPASSRSTSLPAESKGNHPQT